MIICHVWDADGNEFIEYGMGLRAVTLGHAYPKVVAAAVQEIGRGTNFTRPSPLEVECAENYHQGMESVTTQHFDLVIADIVLGGHTGIDMLRQMRDLKLVCPLILITGYPTIETATAAVRLGAHDYLLKPVQKEHLVQVTTLALQRKKTEEQHERLLGR